MFTTNNLCVVCSFAQDVLSKLINNDNEIILQTI